MFGLRLEICSDYHWILFCSDYDWTFVWTTIGHLFGLRLDICSDYDWTLLGLRLDIILFGLRLNICSDYIDETFVWTIRLTTLYSLLDNTLDTLVCWTTKRHWFGLRRDTGLDYDETLVWTTIGHYRLRHCSKYDGTQFGLTVTLRKNLSVKIIACDRHVTGTTIRNTWWTMMTTLYGLRCSPCLDYDTILVWTFHIVWGAFAETEMRPSCWEDKLRDTNLDRTMR